MKITVEFDTHSSGFRAGFITELENVMAQAKALAQESAHKTRTKPSLVGEYQPLLDSDGNLIGKVTVDPR